MKNMTAAQRPNAGMDALGSVSATATSHSTPLCEAVSGAWPLRSEEVHHKLPLAEGGTHEASNLIALCKSCHARIRRNVVITGITTPPGGRSKSLRLIFRTTGVDLRVQIRVSFEEIALYGEKEV